jgi:sulfite exporter TauE/SafE
VAKIFIYSLLGFGLGAVGSKLQITSAVSFWLQFVAGMFIIVTGLRLIWPSWLPWLAITPPAGIRRYIRGHAKSDAWVAPAMLGLLTILIPCGTTIAIETAAVATGKAIQGAAILFAFTLGTAPLFFLMGVLAKGTTLFQKKLAYATAAIVIGLGFYTANGALVTIDSPYSWQNEIAALRVALGGGQSNTMEAATTVTINVAPNGYTPNEVSVPAGQRVTLALAAKGQLGCTSVFRIPKLDLEEQLASFKTTNLNVTFPNAGRYSFSCGMGMYTGTINAV